MKICIAGGTGSIGRALCLRLLRDGHQVTVLTRAPDKARQRVGAEVALVDLADDAAVRRAISSSEAVVNLAGEGVVDKRWSRARQQVLRESRVDLTRRLVGYMAGRPPKVFISASAIGFYGDGGEQKLDEQSGAGKGFLAELCQEWEEAAVQAERLGCRVVRLRMGVVLGDGGALGRMVPIFRKGLGGPMGSGKQYISWIHISDLLELMVRCLNTPRFHGVINAVSPQPVTSRQLAKALGATLHRPAFLPVPALLLIVLYGEMASALLTGQRVLPNKAESLGFRFAFTGLGAALDDLLGKSASLKMGKAGTAPETSYLRGRPPVYQLEQRTVLDAPIKQVFDFFSRAENLGIMTPDALSFSIQGQPPGQLSEGVTIDHLIRLGPLPMRWRTVIEQWAPGRMFIDAQHRGPYSCWWHEHRFEHHGGRTIMVDRVFYALPLSVVGRLVHWLSVSRTLAHIFSHRRHAMAWRFGVIE